jgi:hypothetical protein
VPGDSSSFRTLVTPYHTTQHHITEDRNLPEIDMVMYAIKERKDASELNVMLLDQSIMLLFSLSLSNIPYFCRNINFDVVVSL